MIERAAYRRIYKGKKNWFKLKFDNNLFEDDTDDKDPHNLYNEFGRWFVKECEGYWAHPRRGLLLFSHEEDKVKVILKYI